MSQHAYEQRQEDKRNDTPTHNSPHLNRHSKMSDTPTNNGLNPTRDWLCVAVEQFAHLVTLRHVQRSPAVICFLAEHLNAPQGHQQLDGFNVAFPSCQVNGYSPLLVCWSSLPPLAWIAFSTST
mmetsp:Transcript_3093/g.7778  ORF Transcript_3093/g.7778 Transcript_3093/m.7778 type:complete len:124 (+) Transcript_3093:2001-2372(+)